MELLTIESSLKSKIPEYINSLSLLLTDDQQVRELNFAYRKLDKTTDVLSFSMLEAQATDETDPNLGDIVICIPKAIRQSGRFKTTPANEVLRLLVHGILHLFGYDHVDVSKNRVLEMRKLEDLLTFRYSV